MRKLFCCIAAILLLAGCGGGPKASFPEKQFSHNGLTVVYPAEEWVALDAETIQGLGGTASEATVMLLRTDGKANITYVVRDRSREMTAQAYLALTDDLLSELGSYLAEFSVTVPACLKQVQGEDAVDMSYTYLEGERQVTMRQLVLFGPKKTVTMTVSTSDAMESLTPLVEEMLTLYRLQ